MTYHRKKKPYAATARAARPVPRPPLKGRRRDAAIVARIDPEIRDRLRAYCQPTRTPYTQVIEAALADYLATHRAPEPPDIDETDPAAILDAEGLARWRGLMPDPPRALTAPEAAEIAGVHPTTLARWYRRGLLYVDISKADAEGRIADDVPCIDPADLLAAIRDRRRAPRDASGPMSDNAN